ncbi:Flagellar motor rotation protein MotB [Rhodovulum sp. PH10]|uniref:OmpA/MotB family protein n=1 Tax=Rhodovulum sp. PH10 TaxID=1187851 RepID=UPI00027C2B7C|nr:flagellar motor protein MotB [Rhodovulum sp. PH10]EJW11169.1 Flagellar motor rotation protein MotB [Rhodovulum sp. PH10]
MGRRKEAAGGGHGWFVTFADLMGLLVAFFVMLAAFSTQDKQKLQIVAGSMRDAFGVQTAIRYSGIIEMPGLPTRPKLKSAAHIPPEDASQNPTPDEQSDSMSPGARLQKDKALALAAATLRQAMHDMPELTEASKHIMIEESRDGLNVEIVDQDGRSMFPEGSAEPYERTRQIVQKLATMLKAMPFRISITGHTSKTRIAYGAGNDAWELSAARANAVRRILEEEGVPTGHFFRVAGKAGTEPLFPDDPAIAANRRVTITLVREAPPLPLDFKP